MRLTVADMEKLLIPKTYEPVPDVVEYKMPNTRDVLPFPRCPECGGGISGLSVWVREQIELEQEERFKKSGRGMTKDEYNKIITPILNEAATRQTAANRVVRHCCSRSMVEQLNMPLDVPSYIERYVPGEGMPSGNVKLRLLPEYARYLSGTGPDVNPAMPYNPYSFSLLNLKFEPDQDDSAEVSEDESIEDTTVYKIDIYPSMPPIDDTFEEEIVELPETEGYVVGIVDTGVKGYESVLVRGRTIRAW